MHIENAFDLHVTILFSIIPQLGVIGSKSQDFLISFCLGKVESLPKFRLRDIQERS